MRLQDVVPPGHTAYWTSRWSHICANGLIDFSQFVLATMKGLLSEQTIVVQCDRSEANYLILLQLRIESQFSRTFLVQNEKGTRFANNSTQSKCMNVRRRRLGVRKHSVDLFALRSPRLQQSIRRLRASSPTSHSRTRRVRRLPTRWWRLESGRDTGLCDTTL